MIHFDMEKWPEIILTEKVPLPVCILLPDVLPDRDAAAQRAKQKEVTRPDRYVAGVAPEFVI